MMVDSTLCKYIFERDRLESFTGKWKTLRGYTHCTPSKFAAAGFYYAGSKSMPDNVKCFCCQKELNEWEKDDDPWEEHKKRGEKCMFVQLKKKGNTTFRDFLNLYFEIEIVMLKEAFEGGQKLIDDAKSDLIELVQDENE